MFTGIIEEVGTIKNISKGTHSIKLTIMATKVLEGSQIGDSIAVNGVCLTITSMGKNYFTADIMPESLRKTSMTNLTSGDKVNLERALTLSTRLGGHIVSGHIDGTGQIIALKRDDNAMRVTIEAEAKIMKYIIAQGSVALDGVSLTVANVGKENFTVSLIPHTGEVTTLLSKHVGSTINIENDVIGKYVERLLQFKDKQTDKQQQSSLSLGFLRENGF